MRSILRVLKRTPLKCGLWQKRTLRKHIFIGECLLPLPQPPSLDLDILFIFFTHYCINSGIILYSFACLLFSNNYPGIMYQGLAITTSSGQAVLQLDKLETKAEVKGSLDLLDERARKPVGGKMEVVARLREPFSGESQVFRMSIW